ncbi:MAG: phosphate-starvation-inducible PsiE family protein [Nitrospirae bacterium]|nr:phosphate-starvation-inducible PsiE family protein [Candidatus Troglogloeales bacterium]MBI3598136.1 phosphate-starvation-inducible PsiE family protein [Candidatus Troglogloeales bacterium]
MPTQTEKMYKSSINLMEWLEKWGYITAGVSFLLLGMVVFIHGWGAFLFSLHEGVLKAAMRLMVDLLLVIIFMELFRTLLEFLKTHTLTLEPFLYIGIVAAIRRILTLTAHDTVLETSADQFQRYLWDLGLHGALVLVLTLSLFIYKIGTRTKT